MVEKKRPICFHKGGTVCHVPNDWIDQGVSIQARCNSRGREFTVFTAGGHTFSVYDGEVNLGSDPGDPMSGSHVEPWASAAIFGTSGYQVDLSELVA